MSADQNKGPESLLDPNSPLTKEPGAALEAYMELWEAIERSGFAVSPCRICNQLVVCIPDGLAMCRKCVTEADTVFDEPARAAEETWYYEDQLPSGYDYEANFDRSKVVDGVRMFPAITKAAP